MVGVVRAEVLQGARSQQRFEELRDRLIAITCLKGTQEKWIMAGALSYRLRQSEVTLALVDLLIAVLAVEHDHEVYSLDDHFQRLPSPKLHMMGSGGSGRVG